MSTNELISLLNTVEDKEAPIGFTVHLSCDSNGRYNEMYFYKAYILDKDITLGNPRLIIE